MSRATSGMIGKDQIREEAERIEQVRLTREVEKAKEQAQAEQLHAHLTAVSAVLRFSTIAFIGLTTAAMVSVYLYGKKSKRKRRPRTDS